MGDAHPSGGIDPLQPALSGVAPQGGEVVGVINLVTNACCVSDEIIMF